MPEEIRIGGEVLAIRCSVCRGSGWIETSRIKGGGMTLVDEVKCEKCFRNSGYLLTDNGYAMCAFIELISGRQQ